jgi:hypothetical protein
MEQKWAIRANRTVHFPIRNVFRLVNNRVFNFDVIIGTSCAPVWSLTAPLMTRASRMISSADHLTSPLTCR